MKDIKVVIAGTVRRGARIQVAYEHLESMESRLSLPKDQAGVIHAISTIWMKLCQIEGTTTQL